MPFKTLLQEKLSGKLSDIELKKLPAGFQRIGDIIILNLDKSLNYYKKEIGEVVLELFEDVRTVCNKFGGIRGEFREPQIEYIAGDENSETIHIESGIKYKFDITKTMFAKGNLSERIRIPKQVKKDEIIIDMFAGIGYFSLAIGKLSKAKKIYAIELNPLSFNYLKENIKLNKINNIEAIQGDCRKVIYTLIERGIKADRLIMGYLPAPREFLPCAFKIIKKNGIIHYEDIIDVNNKEKDIERVVEEIRKVAKDYGYNIKLLLAKCIKSYGPKKDHYVFDVLICI